MRVVIAERRRRGGGVAPDRAGKHSPTSRSQAVGRTGQTPCAWRPTPRPTSFFSTSRCRGWTAFAAAEKILASPTPPRVVFLTTFSDDEYIVRALALGAAGYLIKQDVAGGGPGAARGDGGAQRAGGRGAGAGGRPGAGAPVAEKPDLTTVFPQLTDREREVVALIADGLYNREVAAAAYMGEGTVRNHISSILAKLGLRKPHPDRRGILEGASMRQGTGSFVSYNLQ